jgi:DNA repair photolyase
MFNPRICAVRRDPSILPYIVAKRGTDQNPDGRFLSVRREKFADDAHLQIPEDEVISPRTQLLEDKAKSILSRNDSPDVGFSVSVNPYRGCEHGCIYCYARPTHEYLDLSAGEDFESKIFVKYNAAELLRKEISHKKYKVEPIAFSGVTDAWQPVEKKLEITRQCLRVLHDFSHPAGFITKNHLITRDIDLLAPMAERGLAAGMITITTLDEELRAKLEPRASTAQRRLDAIRKLRAHGVPVGVMIAPVIPGLTDHEIPAILNAAADAGAQTAVYIMLRLPHGVKDLFQAWLNTHFPDGKEKVLSRIMDVRGGALNDSRFMIRGRGEGNYAKHVQNLFRVAVKKSEIPQKAAALRTDLFTPVQGTLW